MPKLLSLLCFVLFILTGCATLDSVSNSIVGNDKDIHGCIPSAGYSWCERTKQCERPWELADKVGFQNSEKAFLEYCKQIPLQDALFSFCL